MHRQLTQTDEEPRLPERFNFTRDVVEQLAEADPDRLAIAFVDSIGVIERRTFAQVAANSNRWAELLRRRGLVPGDRVLVHLGQAPEWHDVVLGALKAGLVVVPSRDGALARDLAFYGGHSDSRLVVAGLRSAPELARMDVPVEVVFVEETAVELLGTPVRQPTHDTTADDLALIAYTHRGPGDPYGVVHTQGYTRSTGRNAGHWLGARSGDLVWCSAKLGSARSLWSVLGALSLGAGVVIHDGAFDAEQTLDLMQRLEVTILFHTPAEYEALAAAVQLDRYDVSCLRHAVSHGAKLDREVMVAFARASGLVIHDAYGQSETGILVANAPDSPMRPGSIGTPLPGLDVAVVDAHGNEQRSGVEGDLAVGGASPSLFVEYWDEPEATEATFRGPWYVTGDRAIRDADGYLWLRGESIASPASVFDRNDPLPTEEATPAHRGGHTDAPWEQSASDPPLDVWPGAMRPGGRIAPRLRAGSDFYETTDGSKTSGPA